MDFKLFTPVQTLFEAATDICHVAKSEIGLDIGVFCGDADHQTTYRFLRDFVRFRFHSGNIEIEPTTMKFRFRVSESRISVYRADDNIDYHLSGRRFAMAFVSHLVKEEHLPVIVSKMYSDLLVDPKILFIDPRAPKDPYKNVHPHAFRQAEVVNVYGRPRRGRPTELVTYGSWGSADVVVDTNEDPWPF